MTDDGYLEDGNDAIVVRPGIIIGYKGDPCGGIVPDGPLGDAWRELDRLKHKATEAAEDVARNIRWTLRVDDHDQLDRALPRAMKQLMDGADQIRREIALMNTARHKWGEAVAAAGGFLLNGSRPLTREELIERGWPASAAVEVPDAAGS